MISINPQSQVVKFSLEQNSSLKRELEEQNNSFGKRGPRIEKSDIERRVVKASLGHKGISKPNDLSREARRYSPVDIKSVELEEGEIVEKIPEIALGVPQTSGINPRWVTSQIKKANSVKKIVDLYRDYKPC